MVSDSESSPDQLSEETIGILARAAGLQRCWTRYRDEIMAAAREAALRRQQLAAADAAPEPWSSMDPPATSPD